MGTSQLIYAFAAAVVAAVLSIQFFAGSMSSASVMNKNEILTQVSGVATEIIEDIGAHAFDRRTRDDLFAHPPTSPDDLTDTSEFGGIGLEDCKTQCRDIDDFHGLVFRRTSGGFDFDASVSARYVDPENPDRATPSKTFAKEVLLRVTNPNIHLRSKPDVLIPIEIGRVLAYRGKQ